MVCISNPYQPLNCLPPWPGLNPQSWDQKANTQPSHRGGLGMQCDLDCIKICMISEHKSIWQPWTRSQFSLLPFWGKVIKHSFVQRHLMRWHHWNMLAPTRPFMVKAISIMLCFARVCLPLCSFDIPISFRHLYYVTRCISLHLTKTHAPTILHSLRWLASSFTWLPCNCHVRSSEQYGSRLPEYTGADSLLLRKKVVSIDLSRCPPFILSYLSL